MMKILMVRCTAGILLLTAAVMSFAADDIAVDSSADTSASSTVDSSANYGTIVKVLNRFHQAAANSDSKTYFSLLTADAVFLGTDATERWEKPAFKAFAEPYFSEGRGWEYTPTVQNISVSEDGETAFFDELLLNKNYGQCRGSGMLRLTAQGWKIVQYNLSIPLPNDLAKDVVTMIAAHANNAD